ncbi:MAG: pyridoxal-phosphate dependent enzyme [Kofleriaceae bacterium]
MTATPLVPLTSLDAQLHAKLEFLHPSGSMKHRAIPPFLAALRASPRGRELTDVIVRSAGAAAVTAAWSCAQLGLRATAVLPPSASDQLLALLGWLGATAHRAPLPEGTALMARLGRAPGAYVLDQAREPGLTDPYRVVAAELLAQLPALASVVVGIGTGHGITGIARELRDRGGRVAVYGTEPAEAAVASGATWAPHGIPGLAPPNGGPLAEAALLAGIEPVPSAEAWELARRVARETGWLVGPSSGATVAAALRLRARGVRGPLVAICACQAQEYVSLTHQRALGAITGRAPSPEGEEAAHVV